MTNNLLAPVWNSENWATDKIVWPNLSLNPHLNYSVSPKPSASFNASFNKIKRMDTSVRSRQKFSKFDHLCPSSKSFVTKGFYETVLDVDNILGLLKDDIKELKNREISNSYYEYGRGEFLLSESPAFIELGDMLGTWNITKLASDMIGFPVHLHTALLHYSDENDVHFKQVLSDCNYSTKLQGLHRDPKPNIKAILYLENVGEKDGPFSLIPYSHRWTCPYVERMSSQANCTGNYLDNKEKRDEFLGLPKHNRLTSTIGSITDDLDPLSKSLLEKEIKITSDAGSLILFPASGLLHRGGACDPGGTRLNLQITFK